MRKLRCMVITLVFSCGQVVAQTSTDTTALFNEFMKVMSFTTRPYLYYSTSTRMSSEPVLEPTDTVTMIGEFYKNSTDIYSNTGREEMYLQDSLMIEINNERKSIWVRKVDVSTKDNLNLLPANTKDLLDRVKKSFQVRKEQISQETSRLYFTENKPAYSTAATTTLITLDYSEKTFLPQLIEISIELKQPISEEEAQAIHSEGYDETKLIKVVDGKKEIVRKQKVSIAFTEINSDKQILERMPIYKSSFRLDAITAEFTGMGKYKDYEVTKTF